jgi:hypothetical protein
MSIAPPITQQQSSITSNVLTTYERERRGWQHLKMPKPAPIPPAIGKGSGTTIQTTNQQQNVGSKKNSQKKKSIDAKNKQLSKQQVS